MILLLILFFRYSFFSIVQRIAAIGEATFGRHVWAGHTLKDGVLRVERAAIDCAPRSDARGATKEWLELSTVWSRALPAAPLGACDERADERDERDERDYAEFAEDIVAFCQAVPGALQPHLITRAALASGAFHAAVPILEWAATRFASGGGDGGEALRCPRAPVWSALARVYAALGEHDARLAVLAQSTSFPDTLHAVQLEDARDAKGALQLYDATARAQSGGASHAEQMMWYEGRLRCLRALGMWSDVHAAMRATADPEWSRDGERDGDGAMSESSWNQNLWRPTAVDTDVPLYVNALLRLGEDGDGAASYDSELRAFVDFSSALRCVLHFFCLR